MRLVEAVGEIRLALAQIKEVTKDYIHNFYLDEKLLKVLVEKRKVYLVQKESAGAILYKRNKYWQVYFFAIDKVSLQGVLLLLQKQNLNHLIIDLPNAPCEIKCALGTIGFYEYVRLLRYSRTNSSEEIFQVPVGYYAVQSELDQILALMQCNLDKVSDRLPDRRELAELIEKHNVIVARADDGEVASVIVHESRGNLLHWRYWVTAPSQRSSLIGMKLYMIYMKYMRNFQRQVLFVHKGNPVAKIHEKAGFKFDGFEDVVYVWDKEDTQQ